MKKDNLVNETTVHLKKKSPLIWERDEILYLGHPEDRSLDRFIRDNLSQLDNAFAEHGYKFTYIPNLANPDLIRYNYPFLSEKQIQEIKIDTASVESFISGYITASIKYPCFIRDGSGNNQLYYYLLDSASFPGQIKSYLLHLKEIRSSERFSSISFADLPEDKDKTNRADKDFEIEAQRLIKEIQEKVFRLKQMGVSKYVLEQLLADYQPILSRLVITPDYKLFLPDYNNTEIRLHPLPKTVYFFFLKHPEGIRFKHLTDYRRELFSIYKKLTNKDSAEDMYRSIEMITDSTTNSINEKCSRIKEAFYGAFNPTISDYYVITGMSGTPKSIKLDRSLVIWETDL